MNSLPGAFVFATIYLTGQCLGQTGNVDPTVSVFSSSNVPQCPGSGVNLLQNVTQGILDSYIINAPKPPQGQKISVCNNLELISPLLSSLTTENSNGTCNYSYVVSLEATVNGTRTIICMGIYTGLCKIRAPFDCIQMGTNLTAKFPNGDTYPIKCVQSPSQRDLGGQTVYLIELIIKANCCVGLSEALPKIRNPSGKLPILGSLVTRQNCNSTDPTLKLVTALLVLAENPTNLLVAVPFNGSELCVDGYAGVPFIGQDCKVYGVTFLRPNILLMTLFGLPLTQQVNSACATTMVPVSNKTMPSP